MSDITMRTGAVVAAAAIGTLTAAASARPNLVVNGGFETGGLFPWSAPPTIPGLQHFSVISSGGHTGQSFVEMSSTSLLYMNQTIPTTAGNDYLISFWLRRNSSSADNFFVRWEGVTVFDDFIFNQDFMTWHQYSVTVHANQSGSLVQFGQDYFPLFWHLDDVSVVQVPAPGAAAVLGMAAGVVVMRRRRRRGGAR